MYLKAETIKNWVKGKDRNTLVHIVRDCRERIDSNPDHADYVKGQRMIIEIVVAEWKSRQKKSPIM